MVVVFFALIRFRLRAVPLERDEGEYAYAGQLLLQGIDPYHLVYSLKLPGTSAMYAAVLGLFGQNASAVHVGLLLVNAVTSVFLFLIATRLLGRLAGLVTACTYALLSLGATVTGMAAHATHFVVAFAVAAIWLLRKALDEQRAALIFSAGVLFGLAFLMKQPGILFAVWAVAYLARRGWSRPMNWRGLAYDFGRLLAGAALPCAICCVLIARSGDFHTFWFWTFSFLRHYGTAVPLRDGILLLLLHGPVMVLSAPGVWLIALLGATAPAWNPRAKAAVFFTHSLLLVSLIAISLGLYFRPHYFILLLPVVSLLAGAAVSCATEELLQRGATRALLVLPGCLFLLAVCSSLYLQRGVLFRMNPAQVSRTIYQENPFPEALEIAKRIRDHTSEGDTIAVLGSEPEIYFYSHRRSATGFIYMYPLVERQSYSVEMQKQMIHEIESSRPSMLVLVEVPSSWVASPDVARPDTLMAWTRNYISDHYILEGIAEMSARTHYVWGDNALLDQTPAPFNIFLYRKKEQ